MQSAPITQAMLMAAGLGTRLAPFTRTTSKALMPVMGVPIAQFGLDGLSSAGVSRVVANVHHLAGQSKSELLNLELAGVDLKLSDESELLLGSAGGIKKAQPLLGSQPFFLANADVLSDVDWLTLSHHHARMRARYGVSVTLAVISKSSQPGGYREILFDPHTQLITSLGSLVEGRPFYVGAAVIEHEALDGVPSEGPSEFVPMVLQPAIDRGKAAVFRTEGSWYDIGSAELWLQTHLSLLQRLETGNFRTPPSREWQKRISKSNERLSSGVWSFQGSRLKSSTYGGPCYWGGGSDKRPEFLGPHAVLYGAPSENQTLSSGIGFGGFWKPVART